MVMPTLPMIGAPPPLLFFQTLEWLVVITSQILVLVAMMSTLVLVLLLLPYWMLRTIPKHRGPGGCSRCMKTAFLLVGKWVCVKNISSSVQNAQNSQWS